MDEYSPKRHDIAQLKFLCETLYHDCLANLEESNHGWVNYLNLGIKPPVE
ncbi:hypothetical protein ACLB1S_07825 [Escherichia coli]